MNGLTLKNALKRVKCDFPNQNSINIYIALRMPLKTENSASIKKIPEIPENRLISYVFHNNMY